MSRPAGRAGTPGHGRDTVTGSESAVCVECGEVFARPTGSRGPRQKYCTRACRDVAQDARRVVQAAQRVAVAVEARIEALRAGRGARAAHTAAQRAGGRLVAAAAETDRVSARIADAAADLRTMAVDVRGASGRETPAHKRTTARRKP